MFKNFLANLPLNFFFFIKNLVAESPEFASLIIKIEKFHEILTKKQSISFKLVYIAKKYVLVLCKMDKNYYLFF